MITYYEILRPVTPADLDANPRFAEVLRIIPPDGHIPREHFRNLDKNRVNISGILTKTVSTGV